MTGQFAEDIYLPFQERWLWNVGYCSPDWEPEPLLVAGCVDFLSSTDSPNHLVQISNRRETSHDVFVALDIDGTEREYGPAAIMAGGDWDVERIDSTGRLPVRVYVDEELVWDETHEIPTPGENRNSDALVWLESDGEVDAFVEGED